MDLTTAVREMHELKKQLEDHLTGAKREEARLRTEIEARLKVLSMSRAGLDLEKIALAKTIIFVDGEFMKGGQDKYSVIHDAIMTLATGVPVRKVYGDLWMRYFGTKNYNCWHGQREDHEYGYGPRHGSTIFKVGIVEQVRKNRKQSELTTDEIEAAIYYLTNLESIQESEKSARQESVA